MQRLTPGGLVCAAAVLTGNKSSTNQVTPAICLNCPVGQVFREVGCQHVGAKIHVWTSIGGHHAMQYDDLFCSLRKRNTTVQECRNCDRVTDATTRGLVSKARSAFEKHAFYSSYQDIDASWRAIGRADLDTAITRAISCLESTLTIVHENLGEPLPRDKSITGLWKSLREIMEFPCADVDAVEALAGTLAGCVSHLGGLRNALSDAHGKGSEPTQATMAITGLAIGTAAVLATFIIRSYLSWEKEKGDEDAD